MIYLIITYNTSFTQSLIGVAFRLNYFSPTFQQRLARKICNFTARLLCTHFFKAILLLSITTKNVVHCGAVVAKVRTGAHDTNLLWGA